MYKVSFLFLRLYHIYAISSKKNARQDGVFCYTSSVKREVKQQRSAISRIGPPGKC